MKLTEHFSLSEFTRSATADRLHINNTVDLSVPSGQSVFKNPKNLCEQVLEPLREHFGVPIISSGYRCPALNKAVGGVPNSQHVKGEAADLILPSTLNTQPSTLNDWFYWLLDNTHFDQLGYEQSGSTKWIHVSCKLDPHQEPPKRLQDKKVVIVIVAKRIVIVSKPQPQDWGFTLTHSHPSGSQRDLLSVHHSRCSVVCDNLPR